MASHYTEVPTTSQGIDEKNENSLQIEENNTQEGVPLDIENNNGEKNDEKNTAKTFDGIESGKQVESSSMKRLLFRFGFEFDEPQDNNVPNLSFLEIFKIFLWFGCRAFGGPVAQIALMKQELVNEQKWISTERFSRVYAVYQILPGPEAMELACYFGYLAGGRFGSFLGGLGFLLPGFLTLLLISYLYVTYGIDDVIVQRSFTAIQISVSAMIFRATYKLAEGALCDKKKELDWNRGLLCAFCFLTSVINLNFFIALAVAGIMNTFFVHKEIPYNDYIAYFCAACCIGFFVLYVELNGEPGSSMIGSSAGSDIDGRSLSSLFELGLIAGCVTFGGAYTTLPFIYAVAVQSGGWLSQKAFLDAIAITNMLPTPLVTFVTLVGYIGNGAPGAIVMTIGIFLPAFSFTIIGHKFFEAFVNNKVIEPFLDGVGAAVIGLLVYTAFQFLATVINDPIDSVVFLLAFSSLFTFTNKYTGPVTLIFAALAGQVLYK